MLQWRMVGVELVVEEFVTVSIRLIWWWKGGASRGGETKEGAGLESLEGWKIWEGAGGRAHEERFQGVVCCV